MLKELYPFKLSRSYEKWLDYGPTSPFMREMENHDFYRDKNGKLFSGKFTFDKSEYSHGYGYLVNGRNWGMCFYQRSLNESEYLMFTGGEINGCSIYFLNGKLITILFWDMNEEIERIDIRQNTKRILSLEIQKEHLDLDNVINSNPEVVETLDHYKKLGYEADIHIEIIGDIFRHQPIGATCAQRVFWAIKRKERMEEGQYTGENDFMPYYVLQEALRGQVIKENMLPPTIQYVAGVDVAYNDLELRMVGAVVVLDAHTLEVVDQASHEMEINFPYMPGFFSFREVPPILEAFKKLRIQPDMIVCDAQGIAHPKGVGMASHLGIELNIPTIGCAKKRLIGDYDPEQLGAERGSRLPLMWGEEEVGAVLRTQTKVKPMFVSIGHKVDLQTAIDWVLKLCPAFRLPETTRQADQLVNTLLNERTEIDYHGDEADEHTVV